MANDEELRRYRILKLAEDVEASRRAPDDLKKEGVRLGKYTEVDKDALLAGRSAADANESATVTVILYLDESPADDIDAMEEAVVNAVVGADVGRWVGSGTSLMPGRRHFRDVAFKTDELERTVEAIREALNPLRTGPSTEIQAGDVVYRPFAE